MAESTVRLFHPRHPKGRDFDPATADSMLRQGWTDKPVPPAPPVKAPEPVRLYHPLHPQGREFSADRVETQLRQGWTADPSDAEPEPEVDVDLGDAPDDDHLPTVPGLLGGDGPTTTGDAPQG